MKTHVRARWERAILVCAKCEKKVKGGFGPDGRQALSKALAKRNGGGKGRKALLGVIATKCLKVCPKGAVTVVDAGRPGEWLIVPKGTPIAEVEKRLDLLPRHPELVSGSIPPLGSVPKGEVDAETSSA